MQLIIGNKNYSSWSMRSWVLLRHFHIPFTEHKLRFDFNPGSTFYAELARITPAGKVPVLVENDGFAVWDTLAIAEYIADVHPGHTIWPRDARPRARARSLCAEMHAGFTRLRSLCPMNIEAPLQHLGPELFAREEGLRGDPARVGTLIEDALRASGRPLPVRRLRRGERLLCPGGNAHAELRAAGVGYRGQLRGATSRSSGRVRVGRRRAGRTRLRRRERALPPGAGGTGLKHRTAKAVDFAPHRRLTMRHEHA